MYFERQLVCISLVFTLLHWDLWLETICYYCYHKVPRSSLYQRANWRHLQNFQHTSFLPHTTWSKNRPFFCEGKACCYIYEGARYCQHTSLEGRKPKLYNQFVTWKVSQDMYSIILGLKHGTSSKFPSTSARSRTARAWRSWSESRPPEPESGNGNRTQSILTKGPGRVSELQWLSCLVLNDLFCLFPLIKERHPHKNSLHLLCSVITEEQTH